MDPPELNILQHKASDVPADTSDLDSPLSGASDVPTDTLELDIPPPSAPDVPTDTLELDILDLTTCQITRVL